MWADPDRVTPENEGWLDAVLVVAGTNGGKLQVAWGDDGDFDNLARRFVGGRMGACLCLTAYRHLERIADHSRRRDGRLDGQRRPALIECCRSTIPEIPSLQKTSSPQCRLLPPSFP